MTVSRFLAAAFLLGAQTQAVDDLPTLVEALEDPAHGAAWFERIDTDADGLLDANELVVFVNGRFTETKSEPVLSSRGVMREAEKTVPARSPAVTDMDEDGKISFQEFVSSEINIFSVLDQNEDAKVSPEELRSFRSVFSTHAADVMDLVDDDGDGFMHWNEYKGLMTTFLQIDADSNSQLSEEELLGYLALNPDLTPDQVTMMVGGMLNLKDKNKDGYVDWFEFMQIEKEYEGKEGKEGKEEL